MSLLSVDVTLCAGSHSSLHHLIDYSALYKRNWSNQLYGLKVGLFLLLFNSVSTALITN